MSFAAPLNLLWLVPALGAVTLLYMLRRPRRDILVPSTQFWRNRSQETVQVRRLQKLTPQLLYFLQLLAVALLILASAQPQLKRAAVMRQEYCLILDNGLTMQCRDSGQDRIRFYTAQQQATEIIREAAAANATVSIVSTAPPHLLIALTTSQSALLQAINSAQPTDAASDMPGAALIAASALHGQAAAKGETRRSLIVSDGTWNSSGDAVNVVKPLAFSRPELVSVAPQPGGTQDAGILHLVVQRDPLQPQKRLQIFAEVTSTSPQKTNTQVTVREAGSLVSSQSVMAASGAPALVTLTLPAPPQATPLSASVNPTERDDLPADNTAYTILPPSGDERVLLIGGPQGVDPGLERVLSLLPGVSVDVTRVAALPASGAPGGYDLYILDPEGATDSPAAVPTLPGNAMIFSARNDQFVPSSGVAALGEIVDWDRSNQVLRFADLSGAPLQSLSAWQSVGVWQPMIVAQNGIIAASRSIGSGAGRSIQFSFSPQDSGFDRLSAFPILISNAVQWLAQSAGEASSSTAGAAIALAPVRGGWTITRAGLYQQPQRVGQGLCNEYNSPCSESETTQAGIYTAVSTGGTELFARSADLSVGLTPQAHPMLPAFRDEFHQTARESSNGFATSSLLGWAGAIGLIALLAEWGVAHAPRRAARSAA